MTQYTADIGTWERGKMVDIEASSPKDAFDMLAREHGADNIVQIYESESREYVYDAWNGFELYKQSVELKKG
jgi:hypothetical protein